MYGFKKSDIDFIIEQVKNITEVQKVAIFGSRASGEYKNNSDIDIVVYGEKINKKIILKLYELLEEDAPYPFFVDIVNYNNASELLKGEIDKCNKTLYEKIT